MITEFPYIALPKALVVSEFLNSTTSTVFALSELDEENDYVGKNREFHDVFVDKG